VRIVGAVVDGAGDPVSDALIEMTYTIATASPSADAPNGKSASIRGARLAARKPGSTPPTTRRTPVTSARCGCPIRGA
jgi:hypothetical protein